MSGPNSAPSATNFCLSNSSSCFLSAWRFCPHHFLSGSTQVPLALFPIFSPPHQGMPEPASYTKKQVWVTLLFKMCEWLPSLLWSKDSVRSSHYRPSSCIACPLPLSNLNAARWKYSQLLWAQRSLSSTPLEAPCACPCLTQGMHPASTELLQSQFHFSSTRFVAASVPGCSFHHLILGLERLEREGHQDLTAGSKPGSKQIAG